MGAEGWKVLEETVRYIGSEHFIIADAKRGDIGNTSRQYAETFFKTYPCDAITVAPYMGEDSITPFLSFEDKWVILLALVGWLLFNGKGQCRRITSRRRSPKVVKSAKQKVTDSDFEAIAQALNERGFFRDPAESLKQWIERINLEQNSFDELSAIIDLYYRDRFDPLGISIEEREQLKNAIKVWLESR
jgi:hypothetical protein